MSCINSFGNINETFIIEPMFFNADVLSACTSIFTNQIVSCSGDTEILMGNGIISFNGNLYTNDDLTATTINASTYLSGGTNIIDIFSNLGVQLTGGSFNSNNKILSLFNSNGSQIDVSGFTDYYVTGFTLSSDTITIFQNTNNEYSALTISLSAYNLNNLVGVYLPLSGGTVSGDTVFISGLTATTISATTYLNLPVTADTFVTGGTYSGGTLTLKRNNDTTTSDITGFTKYFMSATAPTGVIINTGDRWYNLNNGIELVYIDDGNSIQWVQPSNTPGPPGYSNLMVVSGITTSAITLDININYYGVNYNGNVDISLPNPSGYDGYNIYIKDEGGYAGTYRIRLIPSVGNVDGAGYADINVNYKSLHIVARNNNWWII